MIVLALDVTTDRGGLALLSDGRLVAESSLSSTSGYGQLIFPAIQDLLKMGGVELSAVDCFASASGPGTFTGIRVGLAAVKGLAEGLGKGALGISNLRAIAFYGNSPVRTAVVDARRGEFYWGNYTESLQPLGFEEVGPEPNVTGQVIVQDPEWLPRFSGAVLAPANLAPAIAYCAASDVEASMSVDPVLVEANYIRRSDANNVWRDR